MQRSVSLPRIAAVSAAVLFAAAVAGFGAAFPRFLQLVHPVAALGASGVPRALAFNLVAFVAPGVLAILVAQSLRARMSAAPMAARLGVQMLTLAAMAFAALGLLPLDSRDLLSAASRAHAAAWTVWWIAFVAGGLLLGIGMRGTPHAPRSVAVATCALVALAFALLLPGLVPIGLSQRVAFAAWLLALLLMAPARADAGR